MKDKLVIFILGTTGVGKSKLAIELAKEYNGEIISSDSMQLYKGGDIVTNKVSKEEMQSIPHHMMSFLENDKMDYNIGDFTSQVIPLIDEIHSRGKLPIVVGGTHYYTFSILWNNTTLSDPEQQDIEIKIKLETDSEYNWEKLKELDPEMAEKIHRNDIRKIKRSIDVCLNSGLDNNGNIIKHSDLIKSQSKVRELRYRSCLIWLECSNESMLEKRLNDRVDEMVKNNLLGEVENLFNQSITKENSDGFTKGLSQSIGIKELYNYFHFSMEDFIKNLNITTNIESLTPEKIKEKFQTEKEKILKESLDSIKIHTRKYSVKQTKWIRKLTQGKILDINRFDTINLEKWNELVFDPSKILVSTYINDNSKNSYLNNNSNFEIPQSNLINWKKYLCNTCSRELNGEYEWNDHQNSKQHKKNLKYLEKKNNNNLKRKFNRITNNESNIQNSDNNSNDDKNEHLNQKLKLDDNNNIVNKE